MKTACRYALFALLVLPLAAALAAPMGYSVNSDEPLGDSLFEIDLATGQETVKGKVMSLGQTRSDIEGLAFDKFGVLWGVDDESQNLFPINTSNGLVVYQDEVAITGLGAIQGNDFGLSFTCNGSLYISSVSNESLYQLSFDGTATLVGAEGALGTRISAIAAYGNPAKLYGLGNGLMGDGGPQDNRSLYKIDMTTGVASLIGEIGPAAADYFEAGLSFDGTGILWAITDRRTIEDNLGSQILLLDTETGKASLQSTTTVSGFESLAVAAPAGCVQDPGQEDDGYHRIPTLSDAGKLLAILVLMMAGIAVLRSRHA